MCIRRSVAFGTPGYVIAIDRVLPYGQEHFQFVCSLHFVKTDQSAADSADSGFAELKNRSRRKKFMYREMRFRWLLNQSGYSFPDNKKNNTATDSCPGF